MLEFCQINTINFEGSEQFIYNLCRHQIVYECL